MRGLGRVVCRENLTSSETGDLYDLKKEDGKTYKALEMRTGPIVIGGDY